MLAARARARVARARSVAARRAKLAPRILPLARVSGNSLGNLLSLPKSVAGNFPGNLLVLPTPPAAYARLLGSGPTRRCTCKSVTETRGGLVDRSQGSQVLSRLRCVGAARSRSIARSHRFRVRITLLMADPRRARRAASSPSNLTPYASRERAPTMQHRLTPHGRVTLA